jgi:diguanylate cyclase (GGDEF)-like protein
MRTGQPYVSGAFLGRRLGTDPIVAISVPVERGREGRWGIVQGALDLPALRRFERGLMGSDSQPILITDARGIVVFASAGTRLRYLSNAADSPLLGKGEPDGRPYMVRIPGFTGGSDVSAVRTRTAQGWNIVAMTPRTSFAAEFVRRLGDALPWLAVSLLCGALLARWLSHSLSDPLDELVGRAATLRLDSPTASFRGMGPMPRELRTLARHLHRMSLRLRASYRSLDESAIAAQNARAALQEALENQERQISERTRTLAEANAELQRMSSTDSLTQLPNRRRFNEFLLQAVRNAARTETPLSCLLIDVDHFKAYNDSYGHQPGDWCLSAVGSALRVAVSRPLDMVARYGGEEFAVLLLDTDPAGAATVAERARAAIEALEIEHSGSKVSKHVTISVGVCTLWPHKDTAPHELVAFADAALYAAKEGGRNVCAMRTPDGRIEVAQRAQREDPSQVRARGAAERLLQLLKRGRQS